MSYFCSDCRHSHSSSAHTFSIEPIQLRRSALRFFHSHSGATGVFCLIYRTVYFRCAANLIAASGKICVRRLKVGDLLITILLHCALLCLALLVLGRSWSASHYARNGVILRGYNVSNTVAGRLQFDNSQECIAKNASGVAMRMKIRQSKTPQFPDLKRFSQIP